MIGGDNICALTPKIFSKSKDLNRTKINYGHTIFVELTEKNTKLLKMYVK